MSGPDSIVEVPDAAASAASGIPRPEGKAMSAQSSLMGALLALKAELPALPKDKTNPHFRSKYTSLDTIVDTVGPLLVKHGLVWTTLPGRDTTGEPALNYRLVHAASGEVLHGTMPLMLVKADPQGQGSAITYARRYSITAVLDLVADDDDDGNAAQPRAAATVQRSPQPTATAGGATERPASAKQRSLIFARATEHNMPASLLANVVLSATGNTPRDFETEQAAQEWLNRSLDRLPARNVNPVLEGIAAEVAP